MNRLLTMLLAVAIMGASASSFGAHLGRLPVGAEANGGDGEEKGDDIQAGWENLADWVELNLQYKNEFSEEDPEEQVIEWEISQELARLQAALKAVPEGDDVGLQNALAAIDDFERNKAAFRIALRGK